MNRWKIEKRLVTDWGLSLIYWLRDKQTNKLFKIVASDLVVKFKELQKDGVENFYVRQETIVVKPSNSCVTIIFKPSINNIVIPIARERDKRRDINKLYDGYCLNKSFFRHSFVEYVLHYIDNSNLIKPLSLLPTIKTPFGVTSVENVSLGTKTTLLFLYYVLHNISNSVCLMSTGFNAREACYALIELFNILEQPINCAFWYYSGFDSEIVEWMAKAKMNDIEGTLIDVIKLEVFD